MTLINESIDKFSPEYGSPTNISPTNLSNKNETTSGFFQTKSLSQNQMKTMNSTRFVLNDSHSFAQQFQTLQSQKHKKILP